MMTRWLPAFLFVAVIFAANVSSAAGWISVLLIGIQGKAVDIGIGTGGQVWVVNGPDHYAFKYGGVNDNDWTEFGPFQKGANRVAVDYKGYAWVVDGNGNLWHYNGSGFDQISVPEPVLDVGVNGFAATSTVWILTTYGNAYYDLSPGWGRANFNCGPASRITVDQNGSPWVTEPDGNVWHYDGKVLVGVGAPESGGESDIGASIDGTIWVAMNNGDIWRLLPYSPFWLSVSGAAFNVAVDPAGQPWVVNTRAGYTSAIYEYAQTETLAVADYYNGRGLIYYAPFLTGMSATAVLGGGDRVLPGVTPPKCTQSNMPLAGPLSWIDENDVVRLWLADEYCSRWMDFEPTLHIDEPIFTSGMNASVEEGEPYPMPGWGGDAFVIANQCPYASGPPQTCPPTNQKGGGAVSRSPRSGDYAMVDTNDSRVLIFKYPIGYTSGATPYAVIGYPSNDEIRIGPDYLPSCVTGQNGIEGFHNTNTSGADAPTASTLCYPAGVAFDAAGNLWIADTGNSRVLEFEPNEYGEFSTGQSATTVIGQSSMTVSLVGTARDELFQPQDVKFDSAGNLWVADTFNGRVLQFTPPFASAMPASMVIGQSGYTSSTGAITKNCSTHGGVSQSTMCSPIQLSFDAVGNLDVADLDNNRVMIFDAPLSNGMNASVEIGMPPNGAAGGALCVNGSNDPFTCFYNNGSSPTVSNFWGPAGVAVYPGPNP